VADGGAELARKLIILFAGLGLLAAIFVPDLSFAWFSGRAIDDTQVVTAGNIAVTLEKKFEIVDSAEVKIADADGTVFMPSMLYLPDPISGAYAGNPDARYKIAYTVKNNSGGAAIVQLNIPGLKLREGTAAKTLVDSAAFRLYRLSTDSGHGFFRTAKNPFFEDEIYLKKEMAYDGSNLFGNLDKYMLNSLVLNTATDSSTNKAIELGTGASEEDLGFRLDASIEHTNGVKLKTGLDSTYTSAYKAKGGTGSSVLYLYMPSKAEATFKFILYTEKDVIKKLSNYYQLCGITLDVSDGMAGEPSVVAYATQAAETAYKSFFPYDHGVIGSLTQ
jgi:hypothetical protein